MKKNRKFSTYFFSLFLLLSCTKENVSNYWGETNQPKILLSQEEITSIAYDQIEPLEDDEIIRLIQDFQEIYNLDTDKTRSLETEIVQCNISKRYSIDLHNNSRSTRSKNNETMAIPICEVKVSDHTDIPKFAVVCCDERAPKIIYYGDYESQYEDGVSPDVQFFIHVGQRSIENDIENVIRIEDSLRTRTISKISARLLIPEDSIRFSAIKDNIVTREVIDPHTNPVGGYDKPLQILSFVNPLSKTEWSQGNPYNYQMPFVKKLNSKGEPYDGHAEAGCGVIALAQLFAILKPAMYGLTSDNRNISIDWSYLCKNIRINDFPPQYGGDPDDKIEMVGSLIYRIFKDTNSIINIENGYYSSTSTYNKEMLPYVKSKFKCGSESGKPFNKERLIGSLQLKRSPVLLYGDGAIRKPDGTLIRKSGHAWLIDGFAICRHPGSTSLYNKDHYWSVNMGWGYGTSKRYFLASNDVDCDIFFTYDNDGNLTHYNTKDMTIIYDIEI